MKTYLCLEKCFFRNRLHYENLYYKYPDSVEMPEHKDGRPMFQEVQVPEVQKVEQGGLGAQTVNPAPDKRQPKIIDTTEEKEPLRPKQTKAKTGIKAQKKKE